MNNIQPGSDANFPGNELEPNNVPDEEHDDEWPLSYRMPPQTTGWWSQKLYKDLDNNPVKILYSTNKEQSEILAQRFLDEPIVGFDMEWPIYPKDDRLQNRIGLIQVACEDTIALFHIGLHTGSSSEQIIAPSLRKLIESPDIAKAGVNILHADFSRLEKFFGLKPQGAFELSHLHSLVMYSEKPELLRTKLAALALQVQEHLGLPLLKDSARTSNWSRPLNERQIDYAAADAYAGFMLFHSMNVRRLALDPVPPLPIFAERYSSVSITSAPRGFLRLHPSTEGGDIVIAKDFFGRKEDDRINGDTAEHKVTPQDTLQPIQKCEQKQDSGQNGANPQEILKATEEQEKKQPDSAKDESRPNEPLQVIEKREKRQSTSRAKETSNRLDTTSQQLFERLRERRAILAKQENMPAYIVANNATLENLARRRPLNDHELLEVNGIGKAKQQKYGAEWLEVIAQFLAAKDLPRPTTSKPTTKTPVKPQPQSGLESIELSDLSDFSSAFGSPISRKPQLHTGLSFNFSEIDLVNEVSLKDSPASHSTTALQDCQSEFKNASREYRTRIRMTKADSPEVPANAHSTETSPERSSVYYTPPSRAGSKRPASPNDGHGMPPKFDTPSAFSTENRIFRSKLLAYSRRLALKLPNRPPNAGPLVSDQTLDMLVIMAPSTRDELHRVPGIVKFSQACSEVGTDLLEKVIKFNPAKT